MNFEYINLERNIPGNPNWIGSFWECLCEEGGRWDMHEFWLLQCDLNKAAIARAKGVVDVDVIKKTMMLYIRITGLFIAHYDVNDVFCFQNLSNDDLMDLKERLDLSCLGVMTGEVCQESIFKLKNPLI